MELDIIELLNTILKTTYEFGWKVGAAWDSNQYNKLMNSSGYLRDDQNINASLQENIKKLLTKLGYNTEEFKLYTKEDCSTHENDWNYIAPMLDLKNKEID